MIAQVCPNCDGIGSFEVSEVQKTCPSCKGKGILWPPKDKPSPPKYVPPVWPSSTPWYEKPYWWDPYPKPFEITYSEPSTAPYTSTVY